MEWLPLHKAVLARDAALVEELLRKKQKPVDELCYDTTALHLAARVKSQPVIERLLLARAQTDIKDSNGDTCLHVLATNYDKDCWDLVLPFAL